MAVETERKFLVKNDGWKAGVTDSFTIVQRYLSVDPAVRLRVTGKKEAFLTIKGKPPVGGIETPEFEYAIPMQDAVAMMQCCLPGEIVKTRHHVPFAGRTWEVDVFAGDNAGLVVAEIELSCGDESFEKPDWVDAEVTHDKRYKNAMLLSCPYRAWRV